MEEWSIPEPNSGCTLWFGATNEHGYGVIWHEKKSRLSHRIAYIETHGPLCPKEKVCHRCDNPGCINPGHMFVGSQKQNMLDMAKKGRARKKLNDEIIQDIIANPTMLASELGTRHGLSQASVHYLRTKSIHRHDWMRRKAPRRGTRLAIRGADAAVRIPQTTDEDID